jgi:hypothetical protein
MNLTPAMRTEVDILFLQIAEKNLTEAKRAYQEIMTKSKKHEQQNIDAFEIEKQCSLTTIMFSYFALEAYINKIGHDKILDKELWKELKETKLSTRKKWILFPKLITGKTFDKFRNFTQLRNWRDKLVHYKEYDFTDLTKHDCGTNVSGIYNIINVKNAKIAYETAEYMIKEMNKLLKL